MSEKITLSNKPNVDHFHYPGKDKDGKETNGRLAATVFSSEITEGPNKGQVALGIARARFNPEKPESNENKLSRISGQKKAEARMTNFINYLNDELKPRSDKPEGNAALQKRRQQIEDDISNGLVCILSKDDFNKRVKTNPFVKPDCEFGRNARAINSVKQKQKADK